MASRQFSITTPNNPTPGISGSFQGMVESFCEDIDRPARTYNDGKSASAGVYTGKSVPMVGASARASTWDAGVEASVAHAKINGPAAEAGVHASVLGVGAHARADVVRAEASVLGITTGVGLSATTGVSAGADGLSASILGFGVSLGPRLAIRTPIIDLTCSIM